MPHYDRPMASMAALRIKPVRVHGFTLPPHPLQIIAWLGLIVISTVFFTSMVPAIVNPWDYVIYCILGSLVFISVFSQVIATLINPIDPKSAHQLTNQSPHEYDRSAHAHVIEQSFCYICNCKVNPTSKHCRLCNKCVVKFDHHCRWLNNCVGAKNYRWFFVVLTSTMFAAISITSVGVLDFTAYFTDKHIGSILSPYKSYLTRQNGTTITDTSTQFCVFLIPVPDTVWLAIVAIVTVLSLVISCALIDLFTLHIFLCLNKITTYEYLRPPLNTAPMNRCSCDCSKQKIRVSPQSAESADHSQSTATYKNFRNYENDNSDMDKYDNSNNNSIISISGSSSPNLQKSNKTYDGNTPIRNSSKKNLLEDSSSQNSSHSLREYFELHANATDLDKLYALKSARNREKHKGRLKVNESGDNAGTTDLKSGNEIIFVNNNMDHVDNKVRTNSSVEYEKKTNEDYKMNSGNVAMIIDDTTTPKIRRKTSRTHSLFAYKRNESQNNLLDNRYSDDIVAPSGNDNRAFDNEKALNYSQSGIMTINGGSGGNSRHTQIMHGSVSARKRKRRRPLRYKSEPRLNGAKGIFMIDAPYNPNTSEPDNELSHDYSMQLPPLPATRQLIVPHLDLSYLRSSVDSDTTELSLRLNTVAKNSVTKDTSDC